MSDVVQSEFLTLCQVLRGDREAVNALPHEAATRMAVRAEAEGVAPLLYWRLQEMGWPVGMADVRGRLTRTYYNTLAQNTLLLLELAKLLDLFSQADIPVIVLKGGALADGYYDDIGLRPMGDLDLLLPEPDIERALDIIRARGYQPADVEISQGILRHVAHHESWRGGSDGRLGVELHWHLIAGPADNRNVPVDWFWKQMEWRAGRSVLSGIKIPQLTPTAHLLYLAAHLSLRHGGNNERLIWIYDADRLIRSRRVDWPAFERQARHLGWGAQVRHLLQGSAARFQTPLPEGLEVRLAPAGEWQSFLARRETLTGSMSRLESNWHALKHLAWPLRVRMMVALVFPSPAYLRWRYQPDPAWIWPLYYLYRWGEIGKEIRGKVFGGWASG